MANIIGKLKAIADVPIPPAGKVVWFTDIADGKPKYMDDAGNVFSFEGAAGAYLRHDEVVASSLWTINHGLGARLNVQVYNNADELVMASVEHTSINQTLISFTSPFAGYAIFS